MKSDYTSSINFLYGFEVSIYKLVFFTATTFENSYGMAAYIDSETQLISTITKTSCLCTNSKPNCLAVYILSVGQVSRLTDFILTEAKLFGCLYTS